MVFRPSSLTLVAAVTGMVLGPMQACVAVPPARPSPAAPLLVVLSETGHSSDGLPVLRRHPDPAPVTLLLTQGFSGRMLRLYRQQQLMLRGAEGRVPEPAYLLLSGRTGGFGLQGFVLDGVRKPTAGFVDLLAGSALTTGWFGAVDQIFPHELLHVMVHQLMGEPGPCPSGLIHEVGTRTDRSCAFQEGFAEAMQILAVDDPDALPATQALRDTAGEPRRRRSDALLDDYRAALVARVPLAPPARTGFLLWYGGAAQTQRYFTVKSNGFARTADLPEQLLTPHDPYAAHLLENILPGRPDTRPKPTAQLVAIEGVATVG